MDNASGPRASSWANVVKNKRQNENYHDKPHDSSSADKKMTFKAKGDHKKKQVTRSDQREHETMSPIHSAKSSISTPLTFKDQYLQKVQAAKQLVNQKPDFQQQDTVPARGIQDMANLHAELASMKATISTLEEDLSRKNGDLIQAKAALAGKDLQIEDLQNSVSMLRENIRSITVATQAEEDDLAAKDELIMKLECENAELRDSIHTGIISISQIYGPGSDQAFTRMATKQTEPSGSAMMDRPNDRHDDHSKFVQAPDLKSPYRPPQARKQAGGVSHSRPIHPAGDSQRSGAQKENQSSKQAYRPPKDNPSIKGMHQPDTTTHQPVSQVDNSITDVKHPITDDHHVKLEGRTKDPEKLVECVKEKTEDGPKLIKDAHEAHKNGPFVDSNLSNNAIHSPTRKDINATSNFKTLSELDPSIIRLSPTPPRKNKAHGKTHAITQEQSTPGIENDEKTDPSGNQRRRSDEESKVGEIDSRYRSKGIHESVDIMDGAAPAKVVNEHPKPVDLPVNKADKQPSQVRTQLIFWKTQSPELGESRTAPWSNVSLPKINLAETAVLPTQEDENAPESLKDIEGWVDVIAKNKLNKSSKGKIKSNPKNSPEPAENEELVTEQKLANKSTKPVPREKGIPASLQKRRNKKRPSGTIIGSNSVFSRAAKGQQSEDEAAMDETSTDSKEPKICTPESSKHLSWADEVEEEEARRNSSWA
ncbi:hypothetical protein F5Y00DRAFT_269782 [Daldinia vernicosa]|uniref:uncharacterized protein n=1 Tax=Daldinia vernicosa TaxID=114800 RepID=UPI002008977B|nr:uncharacterized protein F5Y00DRAFT_269782 [Daldinia vernicosa]KAI0849153.1 hypothetical protein F5Y00DRAFT_269782 [Daldinia vernicosa]